MGKKTRIKGPINDTLRAKIRQIKDDYPGSYSDFLYTLMLRINYPKEFQSKYKLRIEPESDSKSEIDFELQEDAMKFWKDIKILFPSIEFALDYIFSQQDIQYPRHRKNEVIYDIHKMEP